MLNTSCSKFSTASWAATISKHELRRNETHQCHHKAHLADLSATSVLGGRQYKRQVGVFKKKRGHRRWCGVLTKGAAGVMPLKVLIGFQRRNCVRRIVRSWAHTCRLSSCRGSHESPPLARPLSNCTVFFFLVVDLRGLTGHTALLVQQFVLAEGLHQLVALPRGNADRPPFLLTHSLHNAPTALCAALVFFAALADWLLFCSS